MDAVKRATFHEQSLELHCTPDIDQALLEQLASIFGKIMCVTRALEITRHGHVRIRIQLEYHQDLLDFNDYIQSVIRDMTRFQG